MNTQIPHPFGWSLRSFAAGGIALILASMSHAAFTPFSDAFSSDSSLNTSVWTTASLNGSTDVPFVSGGALRLNANVTKTGDYSVFTSTRSDFDPFTNGSLQVTLSGVTLGTNVYNTAYANGAFFVSLGSNANGVLPGGAGNLSLLISQGQGAAGSGFTYSLSIDDGATATPVGAISAVPTDVVWTVNGQTQTWSVTLTGATFTSGSFSGSNTASGTFSNFTASSIVGGSYLDVGVRSSGYGLTSFGTLAGISVDSVSAIPEPTTTTMIMGAGVGGLALMLRRKRR